MHRVASDVPILWLLALRGVVRGTTLGWFGMVIPVWAMSTRWCKSQRHIDHNPGSSFRPGWLLRMTCRGVRPHAVARRSPFVRYTPRLPWREPIGRVAPCERIHSWVTRGTPINRRPPWVRVGESCGVPPSQKETLSGDQWPMSMAMLRIFKKQQTKFPLPGVTTTGV
jgi:hypothetical protein